MQGTCTCIEGFYMTSVDGTDRTSSICNPCDATCKSCSTDG